MREVSDYHYRIDSPASQNLLAERAVSAPPVHRCSSLAARTASCSLRVPTCLLVPLAILLPHAPLCSRRCQSLLCAEPNWAPNATYKRVCALLSHLAIASRAFCRLDVRPMLHRICARHRCASCRLAWSHLVSLGSKHWPLASPYLYQATLVWLSCSKSGKLSPIWKICIDFLWSTCHRLRRRAIPISKNG